MARRSVSARETLLVHCGELGGLAFAKRALHLVRTAVVLDCLRNEFDLRFDFCAVRFGRRLRQLLPELLKRVVQENKVFVQRELHGL